MARRGLKLPPHLSLPNEPNPEPDYLSYLRATLPKGWTADAPHIRLIAEHLDAVERGEIDRLAIHMPPRHAKTETVTVRYGAYCIEREPGDNVLVTGYNERFARRLSRKTRNIVASRVGLAQDKTAADEWVMPDGGTFMARGVGSPPTGVGFRRIIIDDPIRRRQDAESETMRERVQDWYTDDLYTRLEPGGAIILIMTKWHEEDLSQFAPAQEPGRWTILNLAALAEENDPLGRAMGEPLWPQRYDAEALERIRQVLTREQGERSWLALYQQRPTPREGDFFKVSQLQVVDAAPVNLSARCRAWDFAASTEGDYTAGVDMARGQDGLFYVMDVKRDKWLTDERNNVVVQTAAVDGRGVRVRVPQDPGSAGLDTARHLLRLLAGYSVAAERVTGDKETRADPFAVQVNAGNVRLVRGDWNRAFIEELRQFPNGKHDDQVDAASDAFQIVATRPKFSF